jgi:hypothetical protein
MGKFIVLNDRSAPIREATSIYESLDEAREAASSGNALAVLTSDLSSAEIVEEIETTSIRSRICRTGESPNGDVRKKSQIP